MEHEMYKTNISYSFVEMCLLNVHIEDTLRLVCIKMTHFAPPSPKQQPPSASRWAVWHPPAGMCGTLFSLLEITRGDVNQNQTLAHPWFNYHQHLSHLASSSQGMRSNVNWRGFPMRCVCFRRAFDWPDFSPAGQVLLFFFQQSRHQSGRCGRFVWGQLELFMLQKHFARW